MISEKVTRTARLAVLFGTLLGLAAGSTAADLASTYAHDAFPSAPAELTVAGEAALPPGAVDEKEPFRPQTARRGGPAGRLRFPPTPRPPSVQSVPAS